MVARLVYIGAGTSCRLGVLDAAECPPTFSTPPGMVVGLIAGGATALTRAVDGAENDPDQGASDLASLDAGENDVVIGIATSGRTPYVLGAMREARRRGSRTVGLACNCLSLLDAEVDLAILPLVGPEVISGATPAEGRYRHQSWPGASRSQGRRRKEVPMTASTPRSSARLLGIDGGGTTTEAWLAKPGCHVLGRGTSGPSNAKAVGAEAARWAIDSAIRGAFHAARLTPAPVDAICLGLAGFDRPDDCKILAGWADDARWGHRLVMVNDGDLVVAAGTPKGWGVGVIAGTGSIAVGRATDGRTARAGGWGHLIGDEGSAYGVVLNALRLVARRADGRDPRPPGRDPLTERI